MLCIGYEEATAVEDETDGKDDLRLRKLRPFASPPSPSCRSNTGAAATGTKRWGEKRYSALSSPHTQA